MDAPPAAPPTTPPIPAPRLAVLAVVTRAAAAGPEVLLVRRANPPQAGLWGFPGGKVEWGEDLASAARRELLEETGLEGRDPRPFAAVDLIEAGAHHLMVALRLDLPPAGPRDRRTAPPRARDDALEARWAPAAALPQPLCADVARVVAQALAETR